MLIDIHQRGNLRFPQSLPEFQRLFPYTPSAYLEKALWSDGFVCPHCRRRESRSASQIVLASCAAASAAVHRIDGGNVIARSHTPLSVWFWSAYLCPPHPASAVQLRRQLSLSRYETAFQILHKLRAGWCAQISTASAADPASTSKSMKPLAPTRGKAVSSTIRFLSPALLGSPAQAAHQALQAEEYRYALGSPSCRTAARSRSAASCSAPLPTL